MIGNLKRIWAVGFASAGLILLSGLSVQAEEESSPAAGVWILQKAVCPGTCESWYQEKVQSLKGKQLILLADRYEDPIEGFSGQCNTGVDFRYLKSQPGNVFVRELPIEVEGKGASNDFDPVKLGVSDKRIIAGLISCRGKGNLATIFMPTTDQLDMYLEGGVFALFKKKRE